MFFRLLFLLATIGIAAANQLPPYIHVCGRRNPHVDECTANTITALKEYLRVGIPELDIPSIEPYLIDEMVVLDGPRIKIIGKNVKLHGLTNFRNISVHIDFEKKELSMKIPIETIDLEAQYNLKMNILFPIERRGSLFFHSKDVIARCKTFYKIVDRNDKQYAHYESLTTNLIFKDYAVDLKAKNDTLREVVLDVLGKNREEVMRTIKPNIEKFISQTFLEILNKINAHVTFDEFFPDRE